MLIKFSLLLFNVIKNIKFTISIYKKKSVDQIHLHGTQSCSFTSATFLQGFSGRKRGASVEPRGVLLESKQAL